MTERARVTGTLVEYLDHEAGLWCNRCMLATGMRFWVVVRSPAGLLFGTRLWCSEHERSRGVVVDVDHG